MKALCAKNRSEPIWFKSMSVAHIEKRNRVRDAFGLVFGSTPCKIRLHRDILNYTARSLTMLEQ